MKRLPQARDAFAVVDVAEAGFARAQHDEFGAAQVGADDFQAGEDAGILADAGLGGMVAAGQE